MRTPQVGDVGGQPIGVGPAATRGAEQGHPRPASKSADTPDHRPTPPEVPVSGLRRYAPFALLVAAQIILVIVAPSNSATQSNALGGQFPAGSPGPAASSGPAGQQPGTGSLPGGGTPPAGTSGGSTP